MKMTLISILLILLLLGCTQTGQKIPDSYNSDNQEAAADGTHQALLEQARNFREAHLQLFGEANGVLVLDVLPDGQGEKVGLRPGDILLTYGSKPLMSREDLIEFTREKNENESVVLTYLRGQELLDLLLNVGRIGVQIASLNFSQVKLFTEQVQYPIKRVVGDLKDEANRLGNQGSVFYLLGRYPQALVHYRLSLEIQREIGNWNGVAGVLYSLGLVYKNLNQYAKALDYYQLSLSIYREIGNRNGEVYNLDGLGNVHYLLGQYLLALNPNQQSLAIKQETGDRDGEASSLNNLGLVYFHLGQYSQALDHHLQSLAIKREIGDRDGEASSLNNLGLVYESWGQYPLAMDHYQQALAVCREIGDCNAQASSLNNLGLVYFHLNQHAQALDYYQQSLAINREIGDRSGEAGSLGNLGTVYLHLDQYSPQTLEYYHQSLTIQREIGDRSGEASGLGNLGKLHLLLAQHPQAMNYFHQSLVIRREIGDRSGEASSLGNLGFGHLLSGKYPQALTKFNLALNISTQINASESLWRAWFGLSMTSYHLDQMHTAILAGKQAVNILQGIRASNISLERNLQNSFVEDKFEAYHALAEMLIEQGRLAEAEQVMAMLKEEEYFDFIQRDGKDDMRTTQTGYTQVEKEIAAELDQFSSQLVTLGKEYEILKKSNQIDEQAEARLAKVEKELEQAQENFLKLLSGLDDYFKEASGNNALEFGKRQLEQLESQQNTLAKHQAVIITTIATKDKLHLLLTTPNVQLARESSIGEKDLNDLIKRFRNALKHPGSDPLPLAQELHIHLVKPLEKDLQQTQAKTLMWSLDGALRYVPLATLHDGQQYLIEKYGLSLYTAAAHNNLHENNVSAWRAAGLGVSQAHPGFEALPAVPIELRSIIRQNDDDQIGVLPGEIHLDQAFNRETFKSMIRARYPVLHIASHFKLQPGNGSASKLLLGDGTTLSLDEFRRKPAFKLHGVDLLTLSACDTAVGDKGAGGEIESFAVMAQLRGANGVLASLWRVEDESTALLMKQLYQLRSADTHLSKAEALRQAQIKLLRGKTGSDKKGQDFSHPYFWAPFVMMGNWL